MDLNTTNGNPAYVWDYHLTQGEILRSISSGDWSTTVDDAINRITGTIDVTTTPLTAWDATPHYTNTTGGWTTATSGWITNPYVVIGEDLGNGLHRIDIKPGELTPEDVKAPALDEFLSSFRIIKRKKVHHEQIRISHSAKPAEV